MFFHYIWKKKNKKHSSAGLGNENVCLYEKSGHFVNTHWLPACFWPKSEAVDWVSRTFRKYSFRQQLIAMQAVNRMSVFSHPVPSLQATVFPPAQLEWMVMTPTVWPHKIMSTFIRLLWWLKLRYYNWAFNGLLQHESASKRNQRNLDLVLVVALWGGGRVLVKIPKLEVKYGTGAWCYHSRPHWWPPSVKAPRAPPQKNKGIGFASGYNWPQSNQAQLLSTEIGFRAINKAAIINFKQAPTCPRHCLSLHFICWVSPGFGRDEQIRTAAVHNATQLMLCSTYTSMTRVTAELRQTGGRKILCLFAQMYVNMLSLLTEEKLQGCLKQSFKKMLKDCLTVIELSDTVYLLGSNMLCLHLSHRLCFLLIRKRYVANVFPWNVGIFPTFLLAFKLWFAADSHRWRENNTEKKLKNKRERNH